MNYWFFIECFLLGMSVSFAIGPIFILIFNQGVRYGFWVGAATALGSALVDGIYFSLGLFGALTLLEKSRHSMFILEFVGGIILLFLGVKTIRKHKCDQKKDSIKDRSILLSIVKSSVITMANPFVVLFFMFVSIKILPKEISHISTSNVIIGSIFVSAGSLTVLSIISLVSSFVGHSIGRKKLSMISCFTGFIFTVVGCYFMCNFFIKCFYFLVR
jgi:threonine/homoserine/homoserine lactone efflux protein